MSYNFNYSYNEMGTRLSLIVNGGVHPFILRGWWRSISSRSVVMSMWV